jgi:hypothetical protein
LGLGLHFSLLKRYSGGRENFTMAKGMNQKKETKKPKKTAK